MSVTSVIKPNEETPSRRKSNVAPETAKTETKTKEVMDREKARQISRRIMAENQELFRKLAQ